MAHIDTNKHGSLGDLRAKAHTPQISTDLGVHLTDDIHENTVIVLGDGSVGHKLRNDGGLTVDFILEERVEILMVRVVGHNDQEDETGFSTGGDVRLDARVVIELDTLGESLKEFIFVLSRPVLNEADIGVLYENIQSFLDGHIVELLIDVARVLFIALETEDSEVLECLGLVHHRVEAVGIL